MKSPFPGMDPFIEVSRIWGDFHHDLITEIKIAVASKLPERYIARTEERHSIALVGVDEKDYHDFLPDVAVSSEMDSRRPRRNGVKAEASVALADEDPVLLRAFVEEEFRDAFIEIYEADPKMRLVTTIEVLSPSNKRRGPARTDFLRKRQAAMLEGINLVEIDLLRGGQRMPMLDPWPDSPYVLMVSRGKSGQSCRVWRGYSLRPLPPIPIPLKKPDPDVAIDLQPMIDIIYERSRYSRSIDYTKPIKPPLNPEETAWLKKQLRSRTSK